MTAPAASPRRPPGRRLAFRMGLALCAGAALILVAAAFFVSLFLREIPLRRTVETAPADAPGLERPAFGANGPGVRARGSSQAAAAVAGDPQQREAPSAAWPLESAPGRDDTL